MVARILVLGTTAEKAIKLLDILCEANKDDIYRRRKNVGIMRDGTELIAMSVEDEWGFYGDNFDCVFYDHKQLATLCTQYGDILERINWCCLRYSRIPGEFQWCAVDASVVQKERDPDEDIYV